MAGHGKRALALIFAALFVASPAFAQSISTQANSVFRDYNTPGNALSGVYNPPKADIRTLFGLVDSTKLSNVMAFGAKGDGTTNDAAAIAAAVATGRCAYLPYTSAGYNLGTTTITVGTSGCVIGENQVKILSQATTAAFRLTSFEVINAPAIIDNLTIDMTGAPSGSTAIRNGTSSGSVSGAQISRILCLNAFECIGDEASASNYVVDEKWSDIRAELTQGRQFYIRRSRGFMWIDTVRVDQTQGGQTLPVTWDSGRFDDVIGLELNRWDSVGPSTTQTTTYQSSAHCLSVNGAGGGTASVWLNRVLCDNSSGDGIAVSNINYLEGNWLEAFQNLGNGITLANVATSNLSNLHINGAVGLTGAAVGANGFTCDTCSRVNVSNLLSDYNTGQGASLASSTNVSIHNYQARNNAGSAGLFSGTSGSNVIDGGSLASNGAAFTDTSSGGGNRVLNIAGYNSAATPTSLTVGASPATICAGNSPETDYFLQGPPSSATIADARSSIVIGVTASASIPVTTHLDPHECLTVTWSTAAPTYTHVVH